MSSWIHHLERRIETATEAPFCMEDQHVSFVIIRYTLFPSG